MLRNQDTIALLHILDYAYLTQTLVGRISQVAFENDLDYQDILIRRLEVIGEATKRLSLEVRETYPNVPWKKMTGLRDILIHNYDAIDFPFIWEIANQHIPSLIHQLEEIMQSN